ncbi:UDP-N-acetyl-D-mannosamine dehydrogenase [Cellulomonas carbonis]|uniref:UDP-N-acetyl-D-mannosaminuronic acid dehydrogenase n=1 Tax=Cellulomonas carbonis T26 TaxID=947969 RepID=A0A0A0BU03_9CELL|nr:UDP-N-acetyl-D-mannosamine dehydrogenase [Cellulomonas carbonis]KGM11445.1 UDP-N-acetyl-D-mannosaminuronic acid dehydrogenase [Cellulomonas carbonis T26]GGC10687.1 UDP-N-acetyl-D-mannosamine dehydrogenase [Cellulomonas carbonis]
MDDTTTIAVIGLGYIGLPTAAVLATHGAQVIGVDVNTATVEAVNRGEVPFVEPDLSVAVSGAVTQGRLKATTETPPADVFIVAVPTPFAEDYSADLSYIDAAADGIAPQLQGGELIILESTSPPGATQHMADRILAARPDLRVGGEAGRNQIHVAHCPERVLPGRVMIELVTNDRIVGGLTKEAAQRAKAVYETFCQGDILVTDAVTAEMAKLVENSFRDVNIAFANELSVICGKLGVDVWELIELANRHPRVNILQPGPGVGGHCIAVDPWFIVSSAPEEARLIRTAREVNDAKPGLVIERVLEKAARFRSPRIATLGLAFKPDIDDLRESPALRIVERLAKELPDVRIDAVEPHVEELPRSLADVPNVTLRDLDSAVKDADIVVLLVDHTVFKNADRRKLRLREKVVIDTRGVWRG